jgi:hypothetical protein
MLQAARAEKKKLRDFDLRMDSHEAALAEMQNHFSGYQFLGTWASSQSGSALALRSARRKRSSKD